MAMAATARAKVAQKIKVLFCKCKDCSHWELVQVGRKTIIKCLTCNVEYTAAVKVPKHTQLTWVERDMI